MTQTLLKNAVLLAVFLAPPARGDVVLVKNGAAKAAVYVSAEVLAPDRQVPPSAPWDEQRREQERGRLRDSARDLARCLERMSGTPVPVLSGPPKAGSRLVPILVGDLAAKAFGPPARTSPYRQGWRLVVSRKGIGLLGESDEAASYAVYELLDRLGCRWFLPGELGEVIPEHKTVAVPEVDVCGVPRTIARDIWYSDPAFKRRNRLGGLTLQAGHALEISGYVTKEQLQAHPDWNAEIGGKRSLNGRLCWGNPEVAEAVAEGVLARLDRQYSPSLSLSPDDGINFCECGKCRALDAGDWDPALNQVSITDRYVHFCNQVAERVAKKHPEVLLGFLAYAQYTRPPVREKLHPSLVPEIAPLPYCRAHAMTDPGCESRRQIRGIVEGWGKAARSVAYYNYMFHPAEVSVPYPMLRQMSEELPVLYGNGVRFWQPETLPNFESVLPGMWLTLRKSWDTGARPADILEEFFPRFYGAAAAPMRRYWTTIDDAWTSVPEHAGCGFGYARRFTPQVLKAARAALDAALTASRTPLEYRRVKLQDAAFRQFERFMALRRDLAEGRLAGLEHDSTRWLGSQLSLADEYASSYAFDRVPWTPHTVAGTYFRSFFLPAYEDGARIAREFVPLPPLRSWRYAVDRERRGEALGWHAPEFKDAEWKSTDPAVETWSTLGLDNYYGPVWYRTAVRVQQAPAGKRVFLWVSATDGDVRVYVNGQHVPYVDETGARKDDFSGYCRPASFDITAALRPDAENQIALVGTRRELNEMGTGGLLGPALLYREK